MPSIERQAAPSVRKPILIELREAANDIRAAMPWPFEPGEHPTTISAILASCSAIVGTVESMAETNPLPADERHELDRLCRATFALGYLWGTHVFLPRFESEQALFHMPGGAGEYGEGLARLGQELEAERKALVESVFGIGVYMGRLCRVLRARLRAVGQRGSFLRRLEPA